MKYFLFFIICFNSLLYSQQRDSLVYYTNLAEKNIKENKYKEALYYTQKSIDFCDSTNNIEAQAEQTYKFGKIYFDLKKYNDAIVIFNNSISIFQKAKTTNINHANANYYLGLAYIERNKYNLAELCFNRAEVIQKELKINDDAQLINLQRGILNKISGKKDLALSIFKSIVLRPDNDIILNTKIESIYQTALIEFSNKRYNLALEHLHKALELNKGTKNLNQKSDILLSLSKVYDKMLDKSKAYTFLKLHLNLKESINLANNEKLGINDYETFKENQRLQEEKQLEKEIREKEKSEKFSKLITILAIALISILSLLSLSLYKNNVIRNQNNTILQEKNNELIIAKNKAEQASKARSDFLSTVSHELRTPLNAITGITHLLLEENPKKSQIHYLSSLKFSGDYLTTFINDILEINKIDAKKLEIEQINFNLKQLLKDIHRSLQEIANTNNNNFILKVEDSIPENMISDPTKLSQIFINLINNALKFTANGTVTVIAKLKSLQDQDAIISFEIIDTGIGIDEDKLHTVFESFSQGSIEINRKFGGTGLGLTIVKKLVRILGGRIELESVLGKGSNFSFDLNFKVDLKPLATQSKVLNYDPEIFIDKKILVVEDNKINQMITQKMLLNKQIKCVTIDNGEEAVEIVKNNKFDLILMDVHLTGINGTLATEQIREFDMITPIIALTAISLDENREMLLSYGMNDVITKPFIPEYFYAVIAENLNQLIAQD